MLLTSAYISWVFCTAEKIIVWWLKSMTNPHCLGSCRWIEPHREIISITPVTCFFSQLYSLGDRKMLIWDVVASIGSLCKTCFYIKTTYKWCEQHYHGSNAVDNFTSWHLGIGQLWFVISMLSQSCIQGISRPGGYFNILVTCIVEFYCMFCCLA